VALDEGREGQLGRFAPAGREPLQELPVGQVADRPQVKKRLKPPTDRPVLARRHRLRPPAVP